MQRKESYTIRVGLEGGKVVRAELGQVGKTGEKSFKRIEAAGKGANRTMGDLSVLIKNQLVPAFTAVFTTLSVREIVAYSDTFKQLEGRLKIVADSVGDVSVAQERLFDIAQRTRQPLENLTDLYTRLNLALGDNKKAQFDVLGISETIAKALAVTGEGSAQAKSAILQFSQAIQSDFKSSAQEINSLLDSAPRLAQALQKSLGDGSKSLKQLAKDGELSTDIVLRALEPLAAQAQEISSEFDNMSLTVGQAVTQLDNAFLQIIGQSDLVDSGTSSLAASISLLAQNLETVADVGRVVAVVLGARLLTSLQSTLAIYIKNTAQVTMYQLALARMAGITPVAATATLGLSSAMGVLGSAMAIVGGPIGVALISTMYLMRDASNAAKGAQSELNNQMFDFRKAASDYQNASAEVRKQIENDTAARIEAYKQELVALDIIVGRLEGENSIFKLAREFGSSFGIDTSAADVRGVSENIRAAISELEVAQNRFEVSRESSNDKKGGNVKNKGSSTPSPRVVNNGKTAFSATLSGLKEETEQLQKQITLFGKKRTAVDRVLKMVEIENNLREKNIILSEDQRNQISTYLAQIEEQKNHLEELAATEEDLQSRATDAIDKHKRSYEALDNVVEKSIRGQISSWRDLGSAIIGELQNIAIAKLNLGSDGSALGSVIGGLGGFLGFGGPSLSAGSLDLASQGTLLKFAQGGITDRPAIFGEAGPEAAVPLPDGRTIPVTLSGGGKGGDTYYIDATGADSAAITRLESLIKSLNGSIEGRSLAAVRNEIIRNPSFMG